MSRDHIQRQLDALEHIHYEFQMFIELAPMSIEGCQVLSNAILESWLIHSRNLDEFLKQQDPDKAKTEDVLAAHYGIMPDRRILSSENRKRANKEVAHLTYQRFSDVTYKKWNKVEIYMDIWPKLRDALGQLLKWIEYQPSAQHRKDGFVVVLEKGDEVFRQLTQTTLELDIDK